MGSILFIMWYIFAFILLNIKYQISFSSEIFTGGGGEWACGEVDDLEGVGGRRNEVSSWNII